MAESNKNQTAAERARAKEILGAQQTTHFCASGACPTPHDPIFMRDLLPVVMQAPRRKTVFFHKTCGPKVA